MVFATFFGASSKQTTDGSALIIQLGNSIHIPQVVTGRKCERSSNFLPLHVEVVGLRLQDLHDVNSASDKKTFETRLLALAHDLDFGIISGSLIMDQPGERKPRYIAIGSTPEAFLQAHNDSKLVMRDPVMKQFKESSIPFTYDQQTYIDGAATDLYDVQAQFGYRTGVVIPMHLPEGKHFILGVDRDKPLPKAEGSRMKLMANLQLVAAYAQEAAERLFTPAAGDAASSSPVLSMYEIDVLLWTKRGKHADEVGQILGVTKHTVVYHLRNAQSKLGVHSKHQAVLKAVELGLL